MRSFPISPTLPLTRRVLQTRPESRSKALFCLRTSPRVMEIAVLQTGFGEYYTTKVIETFYPSTIPHLRRSTASSSRRARLAGTRAPSPEPARWPAARRASPRRGAFATSCTLDALDRQAAFPKRIDEVRLEPHPIARTYRGRRAHRAPVRERTRICRSERIVDDACPSCRRLRRCEAWQRVVGLAPCSLASIDTHSLLLITLSGWKIRFKTHAAAAEPARAALRIRQLRAHVEPRRRARAMTTSCAMRSPRLIANSLCGSGLTRMAWISPR